MRFGQVNVTQVRYLTKRKLAYPEAYRPIVPRAGGKKDHSSYFQRAFKEWLGPRNIRGEYYRNRYYYPPQDHKPNYIVQDGKTVVEGLGDQIESRRFSNNRRDPALHPFPENIHCKTNSAISTELRAKIYEDATTKNMKHEEIAHKYGIKLARIEAIVRLYKIEQNFKPSEPIAQDLATFSDMVYKMFPLYQPPVQAENLTEIPIPQRTLHQRFMAISESEPFGPVDAAKVFGIEPANVTLRKLTEIDQNHNVSGETFTHEVIVGTEKQGDRGLFKFTKAKAGNVGYRYGASRRDRKTNRSIGFDRAGNVTNLV